MSTSRDILRGQKAGAAESFVLPASLSRRHIASTLAAVTAEQSSPSAGVALPSMPAAALRVRSAAAFTTCSCRHVAGYGAQQEATRMIVAYSNLKIPSTMYLVSRVADPLIGIASGYSPRAKANERLRPTTKPRMVRRTELTLKSWTFLEMTVMAVAQQATSKRGRISDGMMEPWSCNIRGHLECRWRSRGPLK